MEYNPFDTFSGATCALLWRLLDFWTLYGAGEATEEATEPGGVG